MDEAATFHDSTLATPHIRAAFQYSILFAGLGASEYGTVKSEAPECITDYLAVLIGFTTDLNLSPVFRTTRLPCTRNFIK